MHKFFFAVLSLIFSANLAAAKEVEFSLPILDKLPATEKQEAYPLETSRCDKAPCKPKYCWIYGADVPSSATTFKFSNGLKLTVSDLHEDKYLKENPFSMQEDCAILETSSGTWKTIFAGQGWGDNPTSFFVDEKKSKIYIRETKRVAGEEQPIREYDLKCDGEDCAFFVDKDCLLKIDDPAPIAELEKELKAWGGRRDITKPSGDVPFEYIDKLLDAALSGKKEYVDFFFNQEYLDQYFHFDSSVAEIYSSSRDFLKQYGQKCFADKTIAWP